MGKEGEERDSGVDSNGGWSLFWVVVFMVVREVYVLEFLDVGFDLDGEWVGGVGNGFGGRFC